MIELGDITLSDIFLTLVGVAFGGGALWIFKKVRYNGNVLKGNQAGGGIIGGSVTQGTTRDKTHSQNRNTLKNNKANKDIVGGDVEK